MQMTPNSYFKDFFIYDLKAGFITAIVALPLAIAFAIASGVEPIMGLYTAIIAGMLGSFFGGSTFSVTGPTGAMTVIILSTVHKFGMEGLFLAGFLAGVFQILFGVFRLGIVVKYIPVPVVTGFTAGIGVIIFIGQIANSFGLSLPPQEHVWQTGWVILENLTNIDLIAVTITLFTILCLLFLPKTITKIPVLKNIPASIFALIISTGVVYFSHWQIPQVGIIPTGLPPLVIPSFNLSLIMAVLPAAFTIALLGSIEALLCAVVCDAMANTKHKSDKELIAQGIANTVIPFVHAIPCTAAIARSAVNIREGAKTKYSGVIHALFLLLIVLFLSPLAQYIPKAFLAGILMYVSAKMINPEEWKMIFHTGRADLAVLVITFLLTVLTDLVLAVEIGMLLAVFLLFIRFTNLIDISHMEHYDKHTGINVLLNADPKIREHVSVYTLHGPFFFGTMNLFEQKINEHLRESKPYIVIRMKHVPFIDSTGVVQLNNFIHHRQKIGGYVFLSGLNDQVKTILFKNKEFIQLMKKEHIFEKAKDAIRYISANYVMTQSEIQKETNVAEEEKTEK